MFSNDNTNIHSNGIITNYIDGKNNLKTELTSKDFTLSNPLNNKNINFNISSTNLKMLLGDALFNYDSINDILTISGLNRFVINDRTKFNSDVVLDGSLSLGPDGTTTILDKNKWVLDTTNITQTFDNSGHLLKQKSGSKEPRSRWENTNGSEYTEITPGNIQIKGPNAGITLINPDGKQVKIYIDNTGKLVLDGDTYINGNLTTRPGAKVWSACYN